MKTMASFCVKATGSCFMLYLYEDHGIMLNEDNGIMLCEAHGVMLHASCTKTMNEVILHVG